MEAVRVDEEATLRAQQPGQDIETEVAEETIEISDEESIISISSSDSESIYSRDTDADFDSYPESNSTVLSDDVFETDSNDERSNSSRFDKKPNVFFYISSGSESVDSNQSNGSLPASYVDSTSATTSNHGDTHDSFYDSETH